jgi:hypothetical protein
MLFALSNWLQLNQVILSALWTRQSPTCVANSTITSLEGLIECFDDQVVRNYTREEYDLAQPSNQELAAWTGAISDLLDGNCTAVDLPEIISDDFAIAQWADYCVLYETNVPFQRGWGTFVVPLGGDVQLPGVHLAAPHPIFDGRTSAEAAFTLDAAEARSLLVSGRMRRALPELKDCVHGKTNYVTDPTHNIVSIQIYVTKICC